jgi:hypothetical protein
VAYTAFTAHRHKGPAAAPLTARLLARRVRDLNKHAGDGQQQLFPAGRYHAVFTGSPFEMIQDEEQPRWYHQRTRLATETR